MRNKDTMFLLSNAQILNYALFKMVHNYISSYIYKKLRHLKDTNYEYQQTLSDPSPFVAKVLQILFISFSSLLQLRNVGSKLNL